MNDSLLKAAQSGTVSDIEKLIAKGAHVDAINDNGLGPLHLAAFKGKTDAVKSLIKHGADVNLCDRALKVTPLEWAIAGSVPDTAVALVELGAVAPRARLKYSKSKGMLAYIAQAVSERHSRRAKTIIAMRR